MLHRAYRALLALLLGAGVGCAPLTFSNEASVDFERYPRVSVELAGPDGSQRQAEYLERELREHSGFQRVSRGPAPPEQGAAAQLWVELTLDSSYQLDVFDDDDELDVDVSYGAEAWYRLFAPDGALLDSGIESSDDEPSSFEAAEAALDLIVLHYLRPYRL